MQDSFSLNFFKGHALQNQSHTVQGGAGAGLGFASDFVMFDSKFHFLCPHFLISTLLSAIKYA